MHEHRHADFDAGVQHVVALVGSQAGIRLFAVADNASDSAARMLLVETERLLQLRGFLQ